MGFIFLMIYGSSLLIYILCGIMSGGSTIADTFFIDNRDTFMDFFNSVMYSNDHPYTKYHVIYPSLITTFYEVVGYYCIPFNSTSIEPTISFQMRNSQMGLLAFSLISFLTVFILYKLIRKYFGEDNPLKEILTFLMLTAFPLIYAFERGNSMMYLVVFVIAFIMFYRSDNKYLRMLAYISLGIASGIKIYAVLFGLLILRDRNFRELAIAYSIMLVMMIVPFIFTDGNMYVFFRNLVNYFNNLNINLSNIGNINPILGIVTSWMDESTFKPFLYIGIVGFFLSIIIITTFSRRLEQWKIVALVCCGMTLGMGSLSTYNNCIFLIPLIMMISEKKNPSKLDYVYLILFLTMMIWIPIFPGTRSQISDLQVILPVSLIYVMLITEFFIGFVRKNDIVSERCHLKQIDVKKTVAVVCLATLISAIVLIVPLFQSETMITITNNGHNDVRLASDDESYEIHYRTSSGNYTCSDGDGGWNVLSGEYIVSTDSGFISADEIMLINSEGNRVGYELKDDWSCTVKDGHVTVVIDDQNIDWVYKEYAIVASPNGDMTYYSSSIGSDWIYLTDSDDIYCTMYSSDNTAILGVINSKVYVNGVVKGYASYTFRSYSDYPDVKMLRTNYTSTNITIPGGVDTYFVGFIAPKEIYTMGSLSGEERNTTIGLLLTVVIVGIASVSLIEYFGRKGLSKNRKNF